MTKKPFVYAKVSPSKYLVCKYYAGNMYQYGSIEIASTRTWVFFADTEEVLFLTGNEMVRIGKKILSLNKELK